MWNKFEKVIQVMLFEGMILQKLYGNKKIVGELLGICVLVLLFGIGLLFFMVKWEDRLINREVIVLILFFVSVFLLF